MNITIKRIIASLIDHLVLFVPSLLLSFVISTLRWVINFLPGLNLYGWPFTILPSVSVILFIVYEAVSLSTFKTTIGKRIMHLKVESLDGEMSKARWYLRSIAKSLSFYHILVVFGIYSLYIMWFEDSSTSLHDRLVRSKVYESLD